MVSRTCPIDSGSPTRVSTSCSTVGSAMSAATDLDADIEQRPAEKITHVRTRWRGGDQADEQGGYAPGTHDTVPVIAHQKRCLFRTSSA